MYGRALNLKIAETHGRMEPIPLPVSTAPYFVAVFACLLVLAFRPYRAAKATVDLTSEPNESQISRTLLSILRSVPQSLSSVAKAYGNVFKIGGVTLATMLIVGSAVSFLIFHIDTFAASDLLSGQTVREKTVGLAILCFGTFAIVAIFSWILESKSRLKTLSPNSRSKILGANLLLSALLLCLLLILRDRSFLITTAVLLAVSSGLLNTLPQLVKWSVLDCANINNKGTAAASLGISKRIPNLVVSLAIGSLGRSNLESTIGFAYVILISGNLIALIALGVYVRKIRRLRITLVYPTDQDVALSATVAAKLDETPNTTVEDITRKQFLDRTQLTVSLSSTSEELLTRVLSTLRSENGVVRALLRRIRVKGRRSQD
jgi:hypothetical protein